MKFSVMGYSMKERKTTFDEFAKLCTEHGIKGIELKYMHLDYGLTIQEIREACRKHNIQVSSYNIAVDFYSGSLENNRKAIAEGLETAERIGAKLMLARGFLPEIANRDARNRMINWIGKCMDLLKGYDITMTMESSLKSGDKSMQEDYVRYIDEIFKAVNSPKFGMTFDTGNWPLFSCSHAVNALKKLVPHVAHVHLKGKVKAEGIPEGRMVMTGTGEVDFGGIFQVLKDNSYDGFMSIENGNPEKTMDESMKNLKKTLNQTV